MNQSNNRENNVNGTGSSNGEGVTFGSGSGGQQPDLGRHQATARRKWNKEVNKIVMRCFIGVSQPREAIGKGCLAYGKNSVFLR